MRYAVFHYDAAGQQVGERQDVNLPLDVPIEVPGNLGADVVRIVMLPIEGWDDAYQLMQRAVILDLKEQTP